MNKEEELELKIVELKAKLKDVKEERDSYRNRLETLKNWLYESFVPKTAKLFVVTKKGTFRIDRLLKDYSFTVPHYYPHKKKRSE